MKNLHNYTSFINEGKSNNNDSKIFDAAENGNIEELIKMIKIVDVNLQDKDGWTALMWAARFGKTDCVKLLIKNNTDVNLQDEAGWTALIFAAINDHTETVKTLIDNGADIDLQDEDGRTTLILAAFKGHTETVKTLLDNNVDVNLQDNGGNTALMFAAYYGKTECVKLLIKNGSLVDIHDNGNETALNHSCGGVWKNSEVQEDIINLQPWNIKFFDDRIGFLPELKVKYKDAFIISDINI